MKSVALPGVAGSAAGPDRVPGVAGVLQLDLVDEAVAVRFADDHARGRGRSREADGQGFRAGVEGGGRPGGDGVAVVEGIGRAKGLRGGIIARTVAGIVF